MRVEAREKVLKIEHQLQIFDIARPLLFIRETIEENDGIISCGY